MLYSPLMGKLHFEMAKPQSAQYTGVLRLFEVCSEIVKLLCYVAGISAHPVGARLGTPPFFVAGRAPVGLGIGRSDVHHTAIRAVCHTGLTLTLLMCRAAGSKSGRLDR